MLKIDGPLAEAYRRTDYLVEPLGPGAGARFVLRHGVHHPDWDRFVALEAPGHDAWAMVTGYNPRSETTPSEVNREAHARLERELRALAARVWGGEGRGEDGVWPAEPMWMAVGLPTAEALRLGRAFGQHAILAGRVGGPARILLCESGAALP